VIITFVDVDLVSPAMIGGPNPRALDTPPSLRAPSVRGSLRFWTRALAGDRAPTEVESELWGSIERGQGIGLFPGTPLPAGQRVILFPAKETERERSATPAIALDQSARIRFRLPDTDHLHALAAVVWTWLHLGTLGRRGRRGYGSLLWRPVANDLLQRAGFPILRREEVLASRSSLSEYLGTGLVEVRKRFGVPDAKATRTTHPYFRLDSLDQIFVGRRLNATYDGTVDGMEHRLHGRDPDRRGTAKKEMGSALGERLASPMAWRVFPACGGGYFPVLTWSPVEHTEVDPRSAMHTYLSDLGFTTSLTGRSLSAAAP